MTAILITILAFFVYLFLQSLAINGLYISAAGKSETLPDGTTADSEMILYPLYKFLNQFTLNRIYCTMAFIKSRSASFPAIAGGIIQWTGDGPVFAIIPTSGQTINIDALKSWASAYLNAQVEYDSTAHNFKLYQEVPEYRFSKYIRKPILTCVICMASFWSIFTFLIPVILVFGFSLKIIPIWIGDILCLSYLNYLIFKARK